MLAEKQEVAAAASDAAAEAAAAVAVRAGPEVRAALDGAVNHAMLAVAERRASWSDSGGQIGAWLVVGRCVRWSLFAQRSVHV